MDPWRFLVLTLSVGRDPRTGRWTLDLTTYPSDGSTPQPKYAWDSPDLPGPLAEALSSIGYEVATFAQKPDDVSTGS